MIRGFHQVALVLIDEVHLLSERGRGNVLEAGVVCRIKMISRMPGMDEESLVQATKTP